MVKIHFQKQMVQTVDKSYARTLQTNLTNPAVRSQSRYSVHGNVSTPFTKQKSQQRYTLATQIYQKKGFFCREKRRCRHTLLQPFRKREFANELKFKVTMFTTLHTA